VRSLLKGKLKYLVYSFLPKVMLEFLCTVHVPFIFSFNYIISPLLIRPWNSQNPVRDRRETLKLCIQALQNKPGFLIVETGCQRQDHGVLSWGDDGCSTLIFNLFSQRHRGSVISIDISAENISYASKLNKGAGRFAVSDSVDYLTTFEFPEEIDLLYLDSFDFEPEFPKLSQQHHLNELTAVYEKLKPGCLILIDDADTNFDGQFVGKASLIIKFFESLNISPVHSGYQILYIKP
jgi:hypothetical protein